MTAVGDVTMRRRYYACRHCKHKAVPLDDWAGLVDGQLTPGARRMACLAATAWSFDQASENLVRLCGVRISDQTIRRAALRQGARVKAWQEESAQAVAVLKEAEGEWEFLVDGTHVNTREKGWQEIRLSVYSRRPPGEGVDPKTFTGLDHRGLPKPTASVVLVDKQCCEDLGDRWRAMCTRLGWGDGRGVSVIADGAAWIANQTQRVLPKAQRVVDVYHVMQHLHQCGEALHHGDGQEAAPWARARLVDVVRQGPKVLIWTLQQQRSRCATPEHETALSALLGYLEPHVEALRYGERLQRGLPIGSGQVEGACKTIVGRRLKLNSSRWRTDSTEPMAALCSLLYSKQWDTFWSN